MRTALLAIASGLLSGVIGALLAGHFWGATSTPPPILVSPPLRASVPIPPGWDPTLVQRMTALERRLDAGPAAPAPPSEVGAAAADSPLLARHEQERLAGYQKELAYRSQILDDHAREPRDASWSDSQGDAIKQLFSTSPAGETVQLKTVECRSKTCATTLTFPTPAEALSFLGRGIHERAVNGCKGFVSVPTPPLAEGTYDLTVLYTCR